MTARLSPAQQRVVDAMRDGAELECQHFAVAPDRWTLRDDRVHHATVAALKRRGALSIYAGSGVTLRSWWELAPEYREAR